MITPDISAITTVLLVVNLVLVGLAWHNLKEIRRTLNQFLTDRIEIALAVRKEFLNHTHGPDGKVVI